MAYLVERLEKCLCAWEDFWFLVKAINDSLTGLGKPRTCLGEPALEYAPSFRKKLLKSRQEPMDLSNFLPIKQKDWGFAVGHSLPILPSYIAPWCFHSRRVYSLSEELQAVLNATSLEGVTWEDFSCLFASYAISLQRPVVREEDGRCYDFIMFDAFLASRLPVLPCFRFAFFSQKCDRYEPMSEDNRINIRNRIRNGQWEHVLKLCSRFLEKTGRVSFTDMILLGELGIEVTATAQRLYERHGVGPENSLGRQSRLVPIWDSMIRIVVGMCLYLKTLPSGSPHQSEWRPVPRMGLPDPRAISNEAQVCTVSSCYKLTTEERVMLGLQGTSQERAQYELSCHFRQGHWRRPPGSGQDPNAPKTVHVRPCIVRKDRLREGELPGGSEVIV